MREDVVNEVKFVAYDKDLNIVEGASVEIKHGKEGTGINTNMPNLPMNIFNVLNELFLPFIKEGVSLEVNVHGIEDFDLIFSAGPMVNAIRKAVKQDMSELMMRKMRESRQHKGRMLRETYDIEAYPHVYIGRTDEYYNEDYDDDSVFGHSYEWWTWSEEADDSDFANEGPVFELTEEGKEEFFVWLDAEQVGPDLNYGRMIDWPKKHLSPENEWEYLTNPKNGLSKKLSVNESHRPRGRMSKF